MLPTKTGAVGSAKLALHENGTLEYQVKRRAPVSLLGFLGVSPPTVLPLGALPAGAGGGHRQ